MLVHFSSDVGEMLFRRKRLLKFEKMAFSENLSRISLNLENLSQMSVLILTVAGPCVIRALFLDDAGSSSSKRGRWRGASARTAENASFVGKQLVGNVPVLKNCMIS
jgi:hypothetical protein